MDSAEKLDLYIFTRLLERYSISKLFIVAQSFRIFLGYKNNKKNFADTQFLW